MNEHVASLKKQLEEDPSVSEELKELYVKRAELSHAITDLLREKGTPPLEAMKVLIGSACSMTAFCDQPFRATAYILECMAEFYNYYETTRMDNEQENDEQDGQQD